MENVSNAPFRGKVINVVINGKDVSRQTETLTYEQLFKIAYPKSNKVLDFSASYEYPQNIDKRGKIFHRGESVKLEPGMIFNIFNTSNS